MTHTLVKVLIASNFTEIMEQYWKEDNDVSYGHDKDFIKLAKRITGKKVFMIKNEYPNEGYDTDYFEEIDSNFPIPTDAFLILTG